MVVTMILHLLMFCASPNHHFLMYLCATGKRTSEVHIKQSEFGCNEQNCWYVIFFLKVLISLMEFD